MTKDFMIDITLLRDNAEALQLAALNKGVNIDTHLIFELDKQVKELTQAVQRLQEERNTFTKYIKGKPDDAQIARGKLLREEIDKKENELKTLKDKLQTATSKNSQPFKARCKNWASDKENDVVKKYKVPTVFNFTPKDHLELGTALGMIDIGNRRESIGSTIRLSER